MARQLQALWRRHTTLRHATNTLISAVEAHTDGGAGVGGSKHARHPFETRPQTDDHTMVVSGLTGNAHNVATARNHQQSNCRGNRCRKTRRQDPALVHVQNAQFVVAVVWGELDTQRSVVRHTPSSAVEAHTRWRWPAVPKRAPSLPRNTIFIRHPLECRRTSNVPFPMSPLNTKSPTESPPIVRVERLEAQDPALVHVQNAQFVVAVVLGKVWARHTTLGCATHTSHLRSGSPHRRWRWRRRFQTRAPSLSKHHFHQTTTQWLCHQWLCQG